MNRGRTILLSFDVEEFDMPVEYRDLMTTDRQLAKGYEGLLRIKQLLSCSNIAATLFTTGNFASHYPFIIRELSFTHEIASHSYYHSTFRKEDLVESRIKLEKITGKKITGLRMPRMKILPAKDIVAAGFTYDASVNPLWLPGRYNNWDKSRTVFKEDALTRIPASVSSFLRIPLFWLSFKNFPYSFYRNLVLQTLKRDGYVSLYFHPWEFIDLKKYKMPGYTKKPSGDKLLKKLEKLIGDLKNEGEFQKMNVFSENFIPVEK